MKSTTRAAAAALVAVALASPCWAGQVRLEIRDGLVTLTAKDASVREVLAEWSRVGQTRVVNADRVPSAPVTLELTGVPEAKALDILLRSVAGYLAAPRPVAAGGSRYDRIVIMPMARPAPAGASPATAPVTSPQPYEQRRMYQPQPSLMLDDQDEPVSQQPQPGQGRPPMPPYGASGANQPGTMTPAPSGGQYPYPQGQQPATGQPGMAQPGMMQPGMTQPGMTQPGMTQPSTPGAAPQSPAATRPGTMTTPGKPPGQPGGPGGEGE